MSGIILSSGGVNYLICYTAKKDDNPEEALKEFRAIVDQEEEQGEWWVPTACSDSNTKVHLYSQGFQSTQTID